MDNENKKMYIVECILLSFGILWLISLLFQILDKLGIVKVKYIQWILVAVAIITVILLYIFKRKKTVIMSCVIFKRIVTLLNIDTFLNLFCMSLNIEKTMDYVNAKDLINVEWSIFSISIALFIFWHVYKTKQLYEKVKIESIEKLSIDNINKRTISKLIAQAGLINQFFPLAILIVNFLFLIGLTNMIYFAKNEILNSDQVLIKLGFYFSTNTLACLLLDIVWPIFVLRKDLLKKVQVTKDECKLLEKTNEFIEKIDNARNNIKNNTEIDESEKVDKLLKLNEIAYELCNKEIFDTKQIGEHEEK